MYEHELSAAEKVSNDGTRTFSPDGHGSDEELEVEHLEPAEATCSYDVPVVVTDQQGSDSSDCECCNSTCTEPYQPQSDTHIKKQNKIGHSKRLGVVIMHGLHIVLNVRNCFVLIVVWQHRNN